MITIQEDKEVMRALLVADKFIARYGFKPENIKTSRVDTGVVSPNRITSSINISLGNPERSSSNIAKNIVYKVTVSGNRNIQPKIDEVVEQIEAIFDRTNLGRSHILYLLDPPMELVTDPAVYSVETTFLCQCTNFNRVRK